MLKNSVPVLLVMAVLFLVGCGPVCGPEDEEAGLCGDRAATPTPATEPTATPTEPTPTPAEATPTPTPEPTPEACEDAWTVVVQGHFSWVSISPTSFGDQAWGELQPNQVAFWGQLPTGGSTFFACAGPASGKETAAVTGCVSLLAGYRPTAPNGQPSDGWCWGVYRDEG